MLQHSGVEDEVILTACSPKYRPAKVLTLTGVIIKVPLRLGRLGGGKIYKVVASDRRISRFWKRSTKYTKGREEQPGASSCSSWTGEDQ
jgi:hypothetical protein